VATTEFPSRRERFTPDRATGGFKIDPSTPLHQLFIERHQKKRDLKLLVTSADSQTGTGKTTLAFWLCDQWQQLFADERWQAEKHATLDVFDYLDKYRSLPAGSILLLDEAEALDARRATSKENVKFSEYWMKMRVRQVSTILTLPTATALDKRMKELADVWIEVQRRGLAVVHDLRVNSYTNTVQTWKAHKLSWPNVAEHPEMQRLDVMKKEAINRSIDQEQQEEETPDPKEIKREQKIRIAQNLRDRGETIASIAEGVGMSEGWVSNNTESPQ